VVNWLKVKELLMKYVFWILLAWTPLLAQMSVEEIVNKANQAAYYAGKDGRAKVTMTITDKRGDERTREFSILRLNGEDGDQKFYVYFEAPADVRKMAYLVWKDADGDDDRWLWLPALNLVKRIAPGDKRTSFVGSDFVYEDVSGRSIQEDVHEFVGEEGDFYRLKNTPKDAESVEFSYYDLWIDKQTFLPMKAEYHDKAGNLYRRVEALEVETIQGHATVTRSQVSDLVSGSKTTSVFSDVAYDIGLNDRIFTERFLRRPPREINR
jgi:outer membrane lipoprotein-sorting protein